MRRTDYKLDEGEPCKATCSMPSKEGVSTFTDGQTMTPLGCRDGQCI